MDCVKENMVTRSRQFFCGFVAVYAVAAIGIRVSAPAPPMLIDDVKLVLPLNTNIYLPVLEPIFTH